MPHSEYLCTHINQITDEREGTIVCTDCGLVLTDKIFAESKTIDTTYSELHFKIKDILDKLYLPECFISDIIKKYLNSPQKKFLLEYYVYLSLNEAGFPISIKDISNVSGIPDSKIYSLQDGNQTICLEPEKILEKYCKNLEIDYKTYSLIKNELPKDIKTGHNPLTVIGSTIYKYSKKNKLKLSMKKIAEVVNISTVSIQRYIKN